MTLLCGKVVRVRRGMCARRRQWRCRRGNRLGATALKVEVEVKKDIGVGRPSSNPREDRTSKCSKADCNRCPIPACRAE